ncbi:hypothetical protein ABIF21_002448 [Bradyrhizobium elkanii]|uniref:GTPase-associated system all-helical protein GASH n=1 Tax=Bradyrhizobium elkanii TaxID=29448 RepID=UPI0015C3A603|nr:GTPase-associated system all-helical protein GASH [Bradyrhizobium elkanii]NWL39927.1 hypothetical protein [Bradyrhizobium elkanii]
MAEFNFIESYKLLQPATDRAVVDLRKAGFDQIVKSITWGQIVDLGRLAFNLPYDAAVYAEWFQKPLHDADPHFFVAQDAAEAGRIAVLVLRHFVAQGQTATTTALIALASSYAGKRPALDNGELVTRSRDVIAASSKKAAMTAPSAKIGIPKAADHSAKKTEMTNGFDAPRTAALAEALVQDLRTGSEAAVTALSDAYLALRQDNLRLAEEIDMLWWHVGDWSNALDIPRTSISKKSVGLVSGVDLGAMVKFSPGPYGGTVSSNTRSARKAKRLRRWWKPWPASTPLNSLDLSWIVLPTCFQCLPRCDLLPPTEIGSTSLQKWLRTLPVRS